MFYYCNKITEIDLSNFTLSKVSYMSSMFQGCFFDIFIINSNLNNIFIEQINTDLYLKG